MEQEYKVVKRNNMVEATFEYGEDTGLFMFPGGYYHYWNPQRSNQNRTHQLG
ncbi:hypothetical protein [Rubritalea tangerina]|uniref:hypothetical protein n=1 Tax=Rubritalea tangerina TaxID=430798 RepID=UPI003615FAA9